MNQNTPSIERQTNNWAVVSLVLGILSWLFLPVIGAIGAIILGHVAKQEIRKNNAYYSGNGLATAGLTLGYVQLGLVAIGLLGYLALAGIGFARSVADENAKRLAIQNMTITTFDNQTYKLSDYRGKVVVINFWASWARPCEEEAADLEKVWQEYKDAGVQFFGIGYIDTESEARAYIDKWGITYANGLDVGMVNSQILEVSDIPTTFIFDKNGKVAKILEGPTDYATLTTIISRLLEE